MSPMTAAFRTKWHSVATRKASTLALIELHDRYGNAYSSQSFSGVSTAAGSNVIESFASNFVAAGVKVGSRVVGGSVSDPSGIIPTGARVTEVISPTQLRLSVNARAAASFQVITVIAGARILCSTAEISTPAGTSGGVTLAASAWENLITRADPVRLPGAFMVNDWQPCTTALELGIRKLGFQPAGETILHALREFRWDSSATVWLFTWCDGMTSFSDALPRFVRGVITDVDDTVERVRIQIRQRDDWNRTIAPEVVSRPKHLRAAEDGIGQTIPLGYGAKKAPPMRFPFTAEYGQTQRVRELIAGGRAVARTVLIDTGRGGTGSKARVLVTGHAIKQLGANDPDYGTSPWLIGADGKLHAVDPPPADIFLADADGAGIVLTEGAYYAVYPVLPVDVELVSDYADDPRAAMDPHAEYRAARLDYDALKRNLRLRLPSVADAGELIEVLACILYRTGGTPGSNLKFEFANTVQGTQQGPLTLTASSTPTWASLLIVGPWGAAPLPDAPWNLSEAVLRVFFSAAAAGVTVDVYACGLAVKYFPSRDILKVERVVVKRRRARKIFGGTVYNLVDTPEDILTTEIRGVFFANYEGQKDDGSGTFTGAATALIERPPDILTHALVTYALEPIAKLERGTGTLASFVDARSQRTWRGTEIRTVLEVSEDVSVATALMQVCHGAFAWCFLSPSDDTWRYLPWDLAAPVSYAWKFSREHVLNPGGPEVKRLESQRALSGVKLAYGWNAHSRAFEFEASVSPTSSVAGYRYRNMRDGNLTVVAGVNDKLDWHDGTATRVATLAAGRYSPTGLLAQLRTKMEAPDSSKHYSWGYGFEIAAAINDRLEFTDSVNRVAILTPGSYTAEAFAIEVARAMNAVSSGYSCTYSRSTRKLTISKASTFVLNFGAPTWGGVGPATATLGFAVANKTLASSYASDFEVEERLFVVSGSVTFSLLFLTGINGTNGTKTSCADLIGQDVIDDLKGAAGYTGLCPKLDLEEQLAAGASRHGQKRPFSIEGVTIQDSDTALEIRNRVALAALKPRYQLTFDTEFAPDLDRGHVIEFDADLDLVRPYPDPDQDGSWVGKRFVVVELEHGQGPTFETGVTAVSLN